MNLVRFNQAFEPSAGVMLPKNIRQTPPKVTMQCCDNVYSMERILASQAAQGIPTGAITIITFWRSGCVYDWITDFWEAYIVS